MADEVQVIRTYYVRACDREKRMLKQGIESSLVQKSVSKASLLAMFDSQIMYMQCIKLVVLCVREETETTREYHNFRRCQRA